jgi:23S rRNA pseudouridine2457 synthase
VEGEVSDEALRKLRSGVDLKEFRALPCKAQRLDTEPAHPPRDPPIRFRKSVPTSWLELTLTEGKNRQVRRMTAAVGFPTLRLVRVSIGGLKLADLSLQPGQWRELTHAEQQALGV